MTRGVPHKTLNIIRCSFAQQQVSLKLSLFQIDLGSVYLMFLQGCCLFVERHHRQIVANFFPFWIETFVSRIFNNTVTNSPLRVTEKFRLKIIELCTLKDVEQKHMFTIF